MGAGLCPGGETREFLASATALKPMGHGGVITATHRKGVGKHSAPGFLSIAGNSAGYYLGNIMEKKLIYCASGAVINLDAVKRLLTMPNQVSAVLTLRDLSGCTTEEAADIIRAVRILRDHV